MVAMKVAPMAMCVGNYTVNLEPDGNLVITFADLDAGSTDNCGICFKEISLDPNYAASGRISHWTATT